MSTIRRLSIYSLYLFAFVLPWQTRYLWRLGNLNGGYWEYGTISIFLTDIILVLFLSLFFWANRKKLSNKLPHNIWLWLAGLDLVVFIDIFWSIDFSLALYKYIIFLFGIGLFYFISAGVVSKKKIIDFFLLGLVGPACLAIWQFFWQSSFGCKWLGLAYQSAGSLGTAVLEINSGRWLRAYGSFDHPNIMGAVMVIGIILLMWKIVCWEFRDQGIRRLEAWSELLLLLILSLACFVSFSRTAFIGLFVGLLILFYFIWQMKNRDRLKRFILAGGLVIATFLVLICFNKDLFFSRISSGRLEQKSQNERIVGYNEAFGIIKNNLFSGVGLGGYGQELAKQKPGLPSYYYQPAHNVYFLVVSELGIIGFIFWLGMIFSLLYFFWQKKNLMGLALLPVMLTMFLFDHWWWSLHFGSLFVWFVMGISSLVEIKEEKV